MKYTDNHKFKKKLKLGGKSNKEKMKEIKYTKKKKYHYINKTTTDQSKFQISS